MRRFTLILLLLLLLGANLFSVNREFWLLSTNPSATDLAFGYESGCANIWNKNPISTWSNPAKLGYHDGLSFGYSFEEYKIEIESFDIAYKYDYTGSYLSYGYKGIGILLPNINSAGKFGEAIDRGEQKLLDFQGTDLGDFHTYIRFTRYGLGVNIVKFLNAFQIYTNKNLLFYTDLSFGYAITFVKNHSMDFHDINSSSHDFPKTNYNNYGSILRISPINQLNSKDISLDFNIAFTNENSNKAKIIDIYGTEYHQVPYTIRTAVASRMSYKNNIFKPQSRILKDFEFDNLFSIQASYDNAAYDDTENGDINIWGRGLEISLLDLFSVRFGQSNNVESGNTNDFFGYGFNIHYKNLVQLQYNHVKYQYGYCDDDQTKFDLMLNVNLMKILHN